MHLQNFSARFLSELNQLKNSNNEFAHMMADFVDYAVDEAQHVVMRDLKIGKISSGNTYRYVKSFKPFSSIAIHIEFEVKDQVILYDYFYFMKSYSE